MVHGDLGFRKLLDSWGSI